VLNALKLKLKAASILHVYVCGTYEVSLKGTDGGIKITGSTDSVLDFVHRPVGPFYKYKTAFLELELLFSSNDGWLLRWIR
jgi:hypothetical protein